MYSFVINFEIENYFSNKIHNEFSRGRNKFIVLVFNQSNRLMACILNIFLHLSWLFLFYFRTFFKNQYSVVFNHQIVRFYRIYNFVKGLVNKLNLLCGRASDPCSDLWWEDKISLTRSKSKPISVRIVMFSKSWERQSLN